MNYELDRELRECISLCERLKKICSETEGELDFALSGDLLKAYGDSLQTATEKIKKTENTLFDLQTAAMLDL